MLGLSFIRNLTGLSTGLLLGMSTCLTVAAQTNTGLVDNYIVVLRDGTDPLAVAREHANAHALNVASVYEHALKGYAAKIPASRLSELARDSRVLFISPDRPVKASSQVLPTGVNRIQGDLSSTKSGDGLYQFNMKLHRKAPLK